MKALKALAAEIEMNQGYTATPGSRKPGYQNENFYTSTIYQFKKELESTWVFQKIPQKDRLAKLKEAFKIATKE